MVVKGLPVQGIIDTGLDIITTLSGPAFPETITKNNLEKQDFQLADRKACTFNQQPLHLDGQMGLNIKFGEKCVCETVYINLYAPDVLWLSENVCHAKNC